MLSLLRSRSHYVDCQFLILFHAFEQRIATVAARPVFVLCPDGSLGRTRQIAANHKFDRQYSALLGNERIRVRCADYVILDNVTGLIKPI